MEEEDFSNLSLQERWSHSKWSARQSAYKEALDCVDSSRPLPSEIASPEAIAKAASDGNVVALDTGIKLLTAIVLNNDQISVTALQQAALRPMAEKGLAAAKPSVKQAALNAILAFVEVVPDVSAVVDDLLAVLAKTKPPKLIAALLLSLTQIFTEFGSPVTDPGPVLAKLPGQFSHTDKNVRAGAVDLTIALVRWTGKPAMEVILKDIKPVQLKELQDKWSANDTDQKSNPARLTRSQARLVASAGHDGSDQTESTSGVTGTELESNGQPASNFDPWDVMTPETLLDKLPANFETEVSSAKWKERKEALEQVVPVLEKATRLAKADYSHFVSLLEKIIAKDTNQQCASMAVSCIKHMATGLRADFFPYASRITAPVIERFREKKQSFVENITECLDAISAVTSLGFVADVLLGPSGVEHKVPAVKLESARYLGHLLCETPTPPTASEVHRIAKSGVKLLNETSEPIRQAGAVILGALVQIVGERALSSLLSGLDDHRRAKITSASFALQVKAKAAPVATRKAQAQSQSHAQSQTQPLAPRSSATARPPNTLNATARRVDLPPPSIRSTAGAHSEAPPVIRRPDPSTPFKRPPSLNPPSSYRNRAEPEDTSIASPPRSTRSTRSTLNIPTTASTPKVPKRSSHNVDFTPARQQVSNRRRLVSPAKAGVNGREAADEVEETDPQALAALTVQLTNERRRREQAEAALTRAERSHAEKVSQLTEQIAEMQVELDVARGELAELQTQQAQLKMSSLTLNRDRPTNKRHSQGFLPSVRGDTSGDKSQGSPNHNDDSQMFKTSPSLGEGRSDWERAVKMTADLRRRIQVLRKEREI